jgi:hypothetical protein
MLELPETKDVDNFKHNLSSILPASLSKNLLKYRKYEVI